MIKKLDIWREIWVWKYFVYKQKPSCQRRKMTLFTVKHNFWMHGDIKSRWKYLDWFLFFNTGNFSVKFGKNHQINQNSYLCIYNISSLSYKLVDFIAYIQTIHICFWSVSYYYYIISDPYLKEQLNIICFRAELHEKNDTTLISVHAENRTKHRLHLKRLSVF